jgi:hypothetical protein
MRFSTIVVFVFCTLAPVPTMSGERLHNGIELPDR